MPLTTGYVLNSRYRIVKQIQRGGFGAVYRAWDIVSRQPCAVKENLETNPKSQEQFLREATMMNHLYHLSLPRVTNHFVVPGQGQYLVMDFVEGQNLEQILKQQGRPFQENEITEWIDQVCDALHYLHTRQPAIIHRDVKPSNIIINSSGRAVLVDFGISKVYDKRVTATGAVAVTPGYSPPEQYSRGQTEARTDIYALGATVYALLTGNRPPISLERMAGMKHMPTPRQVNSRISTTADQAVMKAMSVKLEERYSTIAEFRQALIVRSPKPPPKPDERHVPSSNQSDIRTPLPVKPQSSVKAPVNQGRSRLPLVLLFTGIFLASLCTVVAVVFLVLLEAGVLGT